MRAVVYTRVSDDRAGGRSPAEQEAEARAECDRRGWGVVEVVTDAVGASRHSRGRREGWERVRGLLGSGQVDVLVTWEASRAQRDVAAYAELRDLCVAHGVKWSYSGRLHDLADPGDRFATGLDALLAEREADETSERVRRAMRANASSGRPHGRRLYGYRRTYDPVSGRPVGQVPDPAEAAVVARLFGEYLAGKGIRTLARELNAEGIRTSTGARWADAQVRRVLVNPAYAGRRVHRGVVVGTAGWPALVDGERFDAVGARFAARRGVRQGARPRLLTGVARCGVCGSKLMVGHDRGKRKVYLCRERFCVTRDERALDGFVTAVVLGRLRRPDVVDALAAPEAPAAGEARERAVRLRGRLDEAVAEYRAGNLSAALLGRLEAELAGEVAEAERVARSGLVPLELGLPAGGAVEGWWAALGGEQRREVVGALLAAVVVHRTRRGARVFDPAAVVVEWRR